MTNKRMFALQIVGSDAFLTMPTSSQLLYFQLGMRADDDGFINNAKTIAKMVGCQEDDLTILVAKGFVIPFSDGVIVIKHWLINNNIRYDRHKKTEYQTDYQSLYLKPNNAYTLNEKEGISLSNTPIKLLENDQNNIDSKAIVKKCRDNHNN